MCLRLYLIITIVMLVIIMYNVFSSCVQHVVRVSVSLLRFAVVAAAAAVVAVAVVDAVAP